MGAFSDKGTLYLSAGVSILPANAGDVDVGQWKSRVFVYPRPVGFGWCRISGNASPMIVRVYADGALIHTQNNVTSRFPFRLPARIGRKWEVEIEGSDRVVEVALATSSEELK